MIEIIITARRAIGTERTLIPRHSRGHTQGCVAIVIVGAYAATHQLAQGIEFFCHDLASGDHRKRIAPVGILNACNFTAHFIQSGVPIGFLPWLPRLITHDRRGASASSFKQLVFEYAFNAQLTLVDVCSSHPSCGNRFAFFINSNFNGTTGRTVAARCVLPLFYLLVQYLYFLAILAAKKHLFGSSLLFSGINIVRSKTHLTFYLR